MAARALVEVIVVTCVLGRDNIGWALRETGAKERTAMASWCTVVKILTTVINCSIHEGGDTMPTPQGPDHNVDEGPWGVGEASSPRRQCDFPVLPGRSATS